MLKEQRFGVEVEMTGISRKKAADVLAEVFGAIAGEPDGTCYHTRIIKDQKDRKWKVMRDSSITPVRNDNSNAPMDEYRVEMVTPPLNYEDIPFKSGTHEKKSLSPSLYSLLNAWEYGFLVYELHYKLAWIDLSSLHKVVNQLCHA